jgi:hypothetical protein
MRVFRLVAATLVNLLCLNVLVMPVAARSFYAIDANGKPLATVFIGVPTNPALYLKAQRSILSPASRPGCTKAGVPLATVFRLGSDATMPIFREAQSCPGLSSCSGQYVAYTYPVPGSCGSGTCPDVYYWHADYDNGNPACGQQSDSIVCDYGGGICCTTYYICYNGWGGGLCD